MFRLRRNIIDHGWQIKHCNIKKKNVATPFFNQNKYYYSQESARNTRNSEKNDKGKNMYSHGLKYVQAALMVAAGGISLVGFDMIMQKSDHGDCIRLMNISPVLCNAQIPLESKHLEANSTEDVSKHQQTSSSVHTRGSSFLSGNYIFSSHEFNILFF